MTSKDNIYRLGTRDLLKTRYNLRLLNFLKPSSNNLKLIFDVFRVPLGQEFIHNFSVTV